MTYPQKQKHPTKSKAHKHCVETKNEKGNKQKHLCAGMIWLLLTWKLWFWFFVLHSHKHKFSKSISSKTSGCCTSTKASANMKRQKKKEHKPINKGDKRWKNYKMSICFLDTWMKMGFYHFECKYTYSVRCIKFHIGLE